MRIVVDTNVLVSAMLSPSGSPARLLETVRQVQVSLLLDDKVLREYREVLRRPELGLTRESVDDLLEQLAGLAEWFSTIASQTILPDPDDLMFIDLAAQGRADCIVTGNKRHFPGEACAGIPVLSPTELLHHLGGTVL